tara:strand:+ start:1274 stop:1648 length:375 start_codon:yes stop_codon:yes gene_type:complete
MIVLIIVSFLLIIFGSIFYFFAYFKGDNYSIENLIQYFNLYRGDTVDFDITLDQNLGYNICKITGHYKNQVLSFEPLKNLGIKKDHTLCEDLIKYTDLSFIGELENPNMNENSKQIEINLTGVQ